jgi:hypothetical protein
MDENTHNKTIQEKQADDKHKLIGILKELPIISGACKRANISRDTYYRWRHEDTTFKQESDDAINQGVEFVSDMSELQLVTLIKEKKMPAIALWLKHNRPRYGGKTTRGHATAMPELTPEDEKLFEELMSPSLGISTNDHVT